MSLTLSTFAFIFLKDTFQYLNTSLKKNTLASGLTERQQLKKGVAFLL